MNAVDFFEDICLRITQGEMLETPRSNNTNGWLHSDALATRLGFEGFSGQSGIYVSRRNESSLTLRMLRLDDFDTWCVLFQACFGHSVSIQHWRWKYRDTDRPGIAAFKNGKMVAFYGGMPRTLLAMGQRIAGIQVGDVMVHPEFRSSLSRKGPFQMVASTFLEQYLSHDAPYQLGFGFPNQRAFKVAQRLGLYRQVDEVVQLNWSVAKSILPPWLTATTLSPSSVLPNIDRIWADMQAGFQDSILGQRDEKYIKSRYIDAPNAAYEWLGLRNRLTGKVVCLGVCKVRSEGLEVLDLLGPPDSFAHMLNGICANAAYANMPNIFMWVSKSHLHRLSKTQGKLTELGICVPTNCWVSGYDDVNIDHRWWLTGGDTDFR